VVEVDQSAMEVFAFTVDELREKRLLRFDPAEVERVELSAPDTLATMVRAGRSWTHANPALGTLDRAGVEAALGAAAAVELDSVLSERVRPGSLPTAPTFRLAVYGGGGRLIDELSCYEEPGKPALTATSRSSGLLARIDAGRLRSLVERFRSIRHGP
jgi:hypothetical protein